MAKRLIDVDLFQSPDLMDLPDVARLLFAGLICNADDEGVARADVKYLRNKLLPQLRCSYATITQYLRTFEARDMLTLRKLNGASCYVINNWSSYQRLRRPRQSRYMSAEDKRTQENTREENTTEDRARNDVEMDELNAQIEKQQKHGPDPDSGRRPMRDMKFGNPYNEEFNKAQAELVDEIAREFCMGYVKAGICVNELGVTRDDWEAWKAYREKNGSRLAVMQIQRFKSPDDIPAEVIGTEQSAPKSFKQQEVDQAKADAKQLRDGEKKKGQASVNEETHGGIDDVD